MVTLVLRKPGKGAHSIEEIYKSLFERLQHIEGFYLYTCSNVLRDIYILNRCKNDIIHFTGSNYYLSLFLINKKSVLTIHDIGHYKELKGIKKLIYKVFWLYLPLRRATQIITVSEYTKRDIINNFNNHFTNKISVLNNPISSGFKSYPNTNTHKNKILQVGSGHNKNIETVIKAIQGLNYKLTIIGYLTDKQKKLLVDLGINYTNKKDLSKEDVIKEYINTDIVTFISTHEGFGMPVIEANAIGRPIICSRLEVLLEVGKEAAYFVDDTFDTNGIRIGIQKILSDKEYYSYLVNKGLENSKRFSMDEIIQEYLNLYNKISKK